MTSLAQHSAEVGSALARNSKQTGRALLDSIRGLHEGIGASIKESAHNIGQLFVPDKMKNLPLAGSAEGKRALRDFYSGAASAFTLSAALFDPSVLGKIGEFIHTKGAALGLTNIATAMQSAPPESAAMLAMKLAAAGLATACAVKAFTLSQEARAHEKLARPDQGLLDEAAQLARDVREMGADFLNKLARQTPFPDKPEKPAESIEKAGSYIARHVPDVVDGAMDKAGEKLGGWVSLMAARAGNAATLLMPLNAMLTAVNTMTKLVDAPAEIRSFFKSINESKSVDAAAFLLKGTGALLASAMNGLPAHSNAALMDQLLLRSELALRNKPQASEKPIESAEVYFSDLPETGRKRNLEATQSLHTPPASLPAPT